MKIDRLLSIIVYLLNHELVSARVLAERYGVSLRTIQRDMETIELAGIPVVSIQGPNGGYGIMENFRMDSQLMSVEDFYYIITSLKSVASTITDEKMDNTLEKIESLMPGRKSDFFSDREGKLSIDFSMLMGTPVQQENFKVIKEAVDAERLVHFKYTSNKLVTTDRTVEPMTLIFRWRSWYLFAWCHKREDYRLFRISRIKEPEILPSRFSRRETDIDRYMELQNQNENVKMVDLVLKFEGEVRSLVEEFHPEESVTEDPEGNLIVKTRLPEDGWVYGFILSYGPYVTVLEPPHIIENLKKMTMEIQNKYE